MRTFRHARKLAIPALVGALALGAAACEVEDDPEVIEQTEEGDVVEGDTNVTEEETIVTETEAETTEPTEGES